MGSGFSEDPVMARYFDYASHAQVLRDHPLFSWEAVVDPSENALRLAGEQYNIPILVKNGSELADKIRPDVAIIATPPRNRKAIVEMLPGLKGIVVEKPLGTTLEESRLFVETCKKKGICVQINFWRRGDELFRQLADGKTGKVCWATADGIWPLWQRNQEQRHPHDRFCSNAFRRNRELSGFITGSLFC